MTMMIYRSDHTMRDINELIKRVDLFHDSYELSNTLKEIAQDNDSEILSSKSLYFINESSDQIEGLFDLCMQLTIECKKLVSEVNFLKEQIDFIKKDE